MSIETKLDRIIELLERIESRLQPQIETTDQAVANTAPAKATKSQIEFKRLIEFAAEMDRTHFFSAIRKHVTDYVKIKKQKPDWKFSFTPQFNIKIDEKIAKTGAQFYKGLKIRSESYARAVEAEAEKVLQRAIGSLTARS